MERQILGWNRKHRVQERRADPVHLLPLHQVADPADEVQRYCRDAENGQVPGDKRNNSPRPNDQELLREGRRDHSRVDAHERLK